MQKRAVQFAKAATLAVIPLAMIWATSPAPPISRSGAPGDTTCATSCHGGAGSASVVVSSTSGMANYTPGASKHFTVTVSGSGGNAGFEISARPASNLTAGVAGNFVAGTGTQALCKVGTTCAAGNPQYIRNSAPKATPAIFDFDWTAPSGTEDVTLYLAAAVGYGGSTATGTYLLKASGAPPTLSVTPASLAFSYQIGGTAPAAKTLSISGAATTYTAAASGGTWLSVTPASGTGSGSATVSVNTTGLAAGSYTGSVTITAAGSSSPKTVPVTFTVNPAAPVLTVTPASLSFAYQMGGTAPPAQTLTIGGAATTYTASASGAWLSVTPASGGTSGTATVSVNTAGLAAGSYTGSVTVTAAGSTGSPKTMPVTFTVTPAAPVLTVSPASLNFAFQIGGTAPPAQALTIAGAATTYTASASGAWLSVTPASGGASGTATVSVKTTGLAAGSYTGSVTVAAAGSTGSPKTVPVTFAVTVAPPTLTANPASLTFAYQIGGTPPAAQTLNISGVVGTFTAVGSGTWLSVSQTSGSASVSVNTTGLAPSKYSGSVTITSAGSTGSPVTVPVTFNVTAAPAPTLTVSPASLSFAYQTNGTAPPAQTLTIGGVATTYTAATAGGTWLSVSPASGGNSARPSVTVNAAGLAAGSYSGSVTITATGSTGSPISVPVTMTITPAPSTLTVSPASLTFAYQTGGTAPAAQSVTIGGASLNYTAVVSGGPWLSVSPASGTAPGSLTLSVSTTGLAAGAYSATVTITAPGAVNGTQAVPVNLTVTDASPTLQVTPANLSFTCAAGTAPLPFVLNVAGNSGAALKYTATTSGGTWLSVAPASGATPGAVFVSVNPGGLSTGRTYNASITIRSTNSPVAAQTIPVTVSVNGSGTSSCPVTSTSTDH